jgi:hypothetical protein
MAKEVKKQPKKAAAGAGRTRKLTKKQQRAKAKKEALKRPRLIGSFRLTRSVLVTIRKYWRTLLGIILVYLILNVIFGGISNISSNFETIKTDLKSSGGSGVWSAAKGFAALVGSSGTSGSATGSSLQAFLFIIVSLVIIWALRHLMSGRKVRVKTAYYNSTLPLIPFLLVILVILIQLLPMTIGGAVLAVIANSVFTNSGAATAAAIIAFALLAAWSIYMVCSSIFAAYIVTLPDMMPRQALKSAAELVQYRRLIVIRRILFMPLFIFVVMGAIITPLILWASFIVPAVFFCLTALALLFAHTYLYSLYRSLLE